MLDKGEAKRAYNRRRYAAKRDLIRAQTAAYRAANPQKIREMTRSYIHNNLRLLTARENLVKNNRFEPR